MNDEMMMKKEEELLKALDGVISEIKDWWKVHRELEAAKNKVPETIDFNSGEFVHFGDIDGSIDGEKYNQNYHYGLVLNHRAFKSADTANLFAEKTQLIADFLFWKALYDPDYVPDWNDGEMKYKVCYNHPESRIAQAQKDKYRDEELELLRERVGLLETEDNLLRKRIAELRNEVKNL